MQRIAKLLALFVIVILALVLLAPFLTGFYIQRNYQSLLTFYNSIPDIHVEQKKYHRGWFVSDATLVIKVKNAYYMDVLNQLGLASQDIPQEYIIDQHIKHGPIFYRDAFSYFGIAAIQNSIQETQSMQRFYAKLGIKNHLIEKFDEFIALNGRYYQHVNLSAINMWYPTTEAALQIKDIDSLISFNLSANDVNGDIKIESFLAKNKDDSISFPDVHYEFHVYPAESALWMGSSSLALSGVSVSAIGLDAIFSNIYYHSSADIQDNQYSTERKLSLDKLIINKQEIGPVHLQASINKINQQSLTNIFTAYDDITQRGELYQSQLQRKISRLLPTLIDSGSNITLSQFDVAIPEGRLHIDGKMQWNMNLSAVPDDLPELLESANSMLNLRVSKSFVNKVINFYVTSPFINDISSDLDEDQINEIGDEIDFNMQNNAALLDMLVNAGYLRDEDAMDLINLQKEMVTIQDYAYQIRYILWEKYLTLPTSYILYWGYLNVENSILKLEKMIHESQQDGIADLQAQVKSLIKQGILLEDKDDYVLVLKQQQGKIQFNKN